MWERLQPRAKRALRARFEYQKGIAAEAAPTVLESPDLDQVQAGDALTGRGLRPSYINFDSSFISISNNKLR